MNERQFVVEVEAESRRLVSKLRELLPKHSTSSNPLDWIDQAHANPNTPQIFQELEASKRRLLKTGVDPFYAGVSLGELLARELNGEKK